MNVEWTPFRWPGSWTDPSALSLLRGTAVNYFLIDKGPEFDSVKSQARQDGLQVADSSVPPGGVALVKGEWAGDHEFFPGELLSLLARARAHHHLHRHCAVGSWPSYRRAAFSSPIRSGVRYDSRAPSGRSSRFALHALGKGRIAVAREEQAEPSVWAYDTVVVVSHRYDLVRFWNGGATGSFYTVSPGRQRPIVQLLFYFNRGPDAASVRVVGRYRSARVSTADQLTARSVEMVSQKEAVEVHLPQVSQYVALDLEV